MTVLGNKVLDSNEASGVTLIPSDGCSKKEIRTHREKSRDVCAHSKNTM